MTISVVTLFPELFASSLNYSIIKRAIEKKILKINFVNIRDFGLGKHKVVDDRPYGGGAGMVMRVDILSKAIEAAKTNCPKEKIILLDPKGKLFSQKMTRQFSRLNHLILVCGHYEGVDERVRKIVNQTISIGDYVLTGGEFASLVIIDAVGRLLPHVLEKEEATITESFTDNLLEYPQYTRPPLFNRMCVPKVLLSGNHQEISSWRRKKAIESTKKLRPELSAKT